MNKKPLYWSALAVAALVVGVIQFIPGTPLQVPAELPAAERADHRVLNFEGINNFRDLGGYPAADGKHVRWGVLYRAGNLGEASRADQQGLQRLNLFALVDFRSKQERDDAPDQLPEGHSFEVMNLPMLDAGNNAMFNQVKQAMDSGDYSALDPNAIMTQAYRSFATTFTPQYAAFFDELVTADGRPVVWHCTAGKDRTGFASAVLLRLLGVPEDVIYRDYMASGDSELRARRTSMMMLKLTKGEEAEEKVSVLLGVRESWLRASFQAIDEQYGSFDNYLRDGLGLSADKQARLRAQLLD